MQTPGTKQLLRHVMVSFVLRSVWFCVANIQMGGNCNCPCFVVFWLPAVEGHFFFRKQPLELQKPAGQQRQGSVFAKQPNTVHFKPWKRIVILTAEAVMLRYSEALSTSLDSISPTLLSTLGEKGQSHFHRGASSMPCFARVLITRLGILCKDQFGEGIVCTKLASRHPNSCFCPTSSGSADTLSKYIH